MSGVEMFTVPGWSLPALFWTGIQASLLVLLAGIGAFALRQGPAAGRHALWTVALAGIVLLPVLPSISPFQVSAPTADRMLASALAALKPVDRAQEARTATAPAAETEASRADAAAGLIPGDAQRERAPDPESAAAQASREEPAAASAGSDTEDGEPGAAAALGAGRGMVRAGPAVGDTTAGGSDVLGIAALVWLAGVGLLVGRFLLGGVILRRLIAGGTRPSRRVHRIADGIRVSLGVRRPVRIVAHDRVTSPMTWGMLRPVVLLPMGAMGWDDDRLRVVFTHELAHIARLDVLTRAVAAVARAIHWFNPLVWWAAARMIAEAERACDDCVLRQGARPSDYADHLLALASGPMGRSMAAAAASPMAQRSGFEGRILAILGSGPRGRFGGVSGLSLVSAGAAMVLLVGSVVPGAAAVRGDVAQADLDEDRSVEAPGPVVPTAHEAEAGSTIEPADPPAFRSGDSADVPQGSEVEDLGRAPAPAGVAAVEEPSGQEVAGQEAPAQEVTTLDRMIRALGDEDEEVRSAIIRALVRQEDPRAVRALMEAVRSDPDAGVRESAAWALGQFEDVEAVPALVEAIRSDDVVEVRRTATWALGQIEEEEAVPGLGEALGDSDAQVRETALWALGQIESPEAIPFLQRALSDSDVEVRRNAIWALGQIEVSEAVPAVTQALSDADAGVRRTAAWALGQIESPSAVPALADALGDEDAGVRRDAIWALGQIESADAVEPLRRALSDADPEIRATAAWALGQIEPREAPAELIDALGDSDEHVRQTAVWALSQIEDPGSVVPLRAMLGAENAESRMGALYALGQIRSEEAVAAIATLLDDPDPEVKRAAARALAGRGSWQGPRPRPRPQPRPRPRPRGNGG